jgi:predicted amidohydrolase
MPDVDQQRQLLERLNAAAPLDDATAFVLLWTYFETIGLTEVENAFILSDVLPQTIAPFPKRADNRRYRPSHGLDLLTRKRQLLDFDQAAVAWLKGVDRLLHWQPGTFEDKRIEGFDGRSYRVRPANNHIASWFAEAGREIAGSRKQSLALAAYCRNFRVVPNAIKGIRIDCAAGATWADPALDDRLRDAARQQLRFLCWPLRLPLRVDDSPAVSEDGVPRKLLRVRVAATDDRRRTELARAVDAARRNKAAVLVLPELSISHRDVAILGEILSTHDHDDFPILTVAGVEHVPRGRSWINAAVILGPYGQLVAHHQKLSRYGDDNYVEQTETGTTLRILESPIGNLATLICLDVFNLTVQSVVSASHANVLLVPSLSPTTSAHERTAFGYLASNLAATFVSNRWIDHPDIGRDETFALLPGKSLTGDTMLWRISRNEDFLLIEIQ